MNKNPPPLYDIHKTYAENLAQGPSFSGKMPHRDTAPEGQWIDFLGYRVLSPLGVPAGPLLDSRWTTLAAQLGYDLVTYKTIRSQQYASHPLPNVIHVKRLEEALAYQTAEPKMAQEVTITNSFGMPSMPESYLLEDIAKARRQLKKGQLLIVSVVGTPGFSTDVPRDFARTASLAKEAGAQAIEANFSCPNISSKEGSLYCDPESARLTASLIAEAIFPLPLMIKVGKFKNAEALRALLLALARANVRAICGINSVSMRVLNQDQGPALGESRVTSGVCGSAIRNDALEFVTDSARIIQKEKLDLELAGCGGIMLPDHIDQFLHAGAKIALTATGMMWDPYLANKWHSKNRGGS